MSLNPYSTGSNSNMVTTANTARKISVLILILLEVTQIKRRARVAGNRSESLNPYSTGSNSNKVNSVNLGSVESVLILILLEVTQIL